MDKYDCVQIVAEAIIKYNKINMLQKNHKQHATDTGQMVEVGYFKIKKKEEGGRERQHTNEEKPRASKCENLDSFLFSQSVQVLLKYIVNGI